jgi:hypothetical protein
MVKSKNAKIAPYSHGGRDMTRASRTAKKAKTAPYRDMTRAERMHHRKLKKPPKPATRAERRVLKAALEWLAQGIYRDNGVLLTAVYALRTSITGETAKQILESFPDDSIEARLKKVAT